MKIVRNTKNIQFNDNAASDIPTPAAGYANVFVNSATGDLCIKKPSGVVVDLEVSGGTGVSTLAELTDVDVIKKTSNAPLAYKYDTTDYILTGVTSGDTVSLSNVYGDIRNRFVSGELIRLDGDRGNPTTTKELLEVTYNLGETKLKFDSVVGVGEYLTAKNLTEIWANIDYLKISDLELTKQAKSVLIMKDVDSGARYNVFISGGTLTCEAI